MLGPPRQGPFRSGYHWNRPSTARQPPARQPPINRPSTARLPPFLNPSPPSRPLSQVTKFAKPLLQKTGLMAGDFIHKVNGQPLFDTTAHPSSFTDVANTCIACKSEARPQIVSILVARELSKADMATAIPSRMTI